MLIEMTKKPYASISALLMFKYFIILDIELRPKEIDPDIHGDNVFNILNYWNKVFPIVREYYLIMKRIPDDRKKYNKIIDWYISFCDSPVLFNTSPNWIFAIIWENKQNEFLLINPLSISLNVSHNRIRH